jgi:hypothetical protein
MSDIAERLRAITGQAGDLGKTDALTGFDRMRAEIARLHAVNDRLRAETERLRAMAFNPLTLTDAERAAVERAIDAMNGVEDISASWSQREAEAIATLRGLLERTVEK